MQTGIVANPEPFNGKTSKWFVAVGVLLIGALIAVSIWIFLSSK